jgi:hypothetical protein
MPYSSPFSKDWKVKLVSEQPIEKFKPEKSVINKSNARQLVGASLDPSQMLWLQRWLEQLVRERSYPPQIAGKEPFQALTQFLAPKDCLDVLELVRKAYQQQYPNSSKQEEEEDFGFLRELETTLQHQRTSLSADHNTSIQSDDD